MQLRETTRVFGKIGAGLARGSYPLLRQVSEDLNERLDSKVPKAGEPKPLRASDQLHLNAAADGAFSILVGPGRYE